MAEYITEILTGGLVSVIALWLIPLEVRSRKVGPLLEWKAQAEKELEDIRAQLGMKAKDE